MNNGTLASLSRAMSGSTARATSSIGCPLNAVIREPTRSPYGGSARTTWRPSLKK